MCTHRASTTHHTIAKNIGPPQTTTVQFIVCAFKSAPLTVGKQSTGIINNVNAVATVPLNLLHRPKFHGPGRNLFPTTNVRNATGKVNAT